MPARKSAPEGAAQTQATPEGGGDGFKRVVLKRIEDAAVDIPIEGITPVIPHKWSEKALKLMRDKQMAEAGSLSSRRQPKNPDEEAEQSCYWLDIPDGNGGSERHAAIPAVSFKAAMVRAVSLFEGLTMVQSKMLFFVEGQGDDQLVPLDGKWAMREDTPRNSGGVADLRYRMAVYPWKALLRVRFMPQLIGPESIFALVDAAGRVGVGDWRPSSPKSASGTFGQFRIVGDGE